MVEQGVQKRAKHAALWYADIQGGSKEGVLLNRLLSISQKVQSPVAEGCADTKLAKLGDKFEGDQS